MEITDAGLLNGTINLTTICSTLASSISLSRIQNETLDRAEITDQLKQIAAAVNTIVDILDSEPVERGMTGAPKPKSSKFIITTNELRKFCDGGTSQGFADVLLQKVDYTFAQQIPEKVQKVVRDYIDIPVDADDDLICDSYDFVYKKLEKYFKKLDKGND